MGLLSFFLAAFPFFVVSVYAQSLSGTYKSVDKTSTDQQTLIFTGDSVQYNLYTNSCLINNFKGKGKWQIQKHRLLIQSTVPNNSVNVTTFVSANPDSIVFKVTNTYHQPLMGATINAFNTQQNCIAGSVTNKNGIAKLPRSKLLAISYISVNYVDFCSSNINVTNHHFSYNIMLHHDISKKWHIAYVSNKQKGFHFKIRNNKLSVNFGKPGRCGMVNDWVVFEKQ